DLRRDIHLRVDPAGACCGRNAEPMVSVRSRYDPGVGLLRRDQRQFVAGPAEFERAGVLEVFELEIHPGAKRSRFLERRLADKAGDAGIGRFDSGLHALYYGERNRLDFPPEAVYSLLK